VIIAAWEAGWDDAGQVAAEQPSSDDLFSRIA
jgi:ribosome modulation factor